MKLLILVAALSSLMVDNVEGDYHDTPGICCPCKYITNHVDPNWDGKYKWTGEIVPEYPPECENGCVYCRAIDDGYGYECDPIDPMEYCMSVTPDSQCECIWEYGPEDTSTTTELPEYSSSTSDTTYYDSTAPEESTTSSPDGSISTPVAPSASYSDESTTSPEDSTTSYPDESTTSPEDSTTSSSDESTTSPEDSTTSPYDSTTSPEDSTTSYPGDSTTSPEDSTAANDDTSTTYNEERDTTYSP